MNPPVFRFIDVDTPAYEEMIDLRMTVLLSPIGISRSYIDPQKENTDLLVGAYIDDRLAGCCILTRLDNTTVQLRQMAVALPHQGKGLGSKVLSFAEKAATAQGYKTLMMHARDTVIPFYRKCGYTTVGEPFSEVGIGHHRMQKQLRLP